MLSARLLMHYHGGERTKQKGMRFAWIPLCWSAGIGRCDKMPTVRGRCARTGGRRSDEEWARRARPRDQQHNLLRIFSRYPTTTTTNNYLTALEFAGILRDTRNSIPSPLPADSQTFRCRKERSYKLCANPSRYADICSFLSNELAVDTQHRPGG